MPTQLTFLLRSALARPGTAAFVLAGAGLLALVAVALARLQARAPRRATTAFAALAFLAVLGAGWLTPQAMIGDEVTHYYMTLRQAECLPLATFEAPIPLESGPTDRRLYAHANGWHYAGALVLRATGGAFRALQTYHALYVLEWLVFAALLARARGGDRTGATLLFVAALASLPMTLIFGVAFYQDVPVAAQLLGAFYFLDRRRCLPSVFLLAFALLLKDTAVLFLPAWGVLLWRRTNDRPWRRRLAALAACVLVVAATMTTLYVSLRQGAGARYYPVYTLRKIIERVLPAAPHPAVAPAPAVPAPTAGPSAAPDRPPRPRMSKKIISHHPGDLRQPVNFLLYGGGLLWPLLALGLFAAVRRTPAPAPEVVSGGADTAPPAGPAALLGTGFSFIGLTAAACWQNPDARFFLPGLPFLLLPAVERLVALPWLRRRGVLALILLLALGQGAGVLAQTVRLRYVSSGLREAITYLEQNRPTPNRVFMYPEGNFRLFPMRHEWYLGYRLRDFWRGDNDTRLAMLREFRVGAIVVKKHLVAPADAAFSNLGIYPEHVVRELRADPRFPAVFENDAILILALPAP